MIDFLQWNTPTTHLIDIVVDFQGDWLVNFVFAASSWTKFADHAKAVYIIIEEDMVGWR